jgi:hypothetical protein
MASYPVTDIVLRWGFNISAKIEDIMELRQSGVRVFERAVASLVSKASW